MWRLRLLWPFGFSKRSLKSLVSLPEEQVLESLNKQNEIERGNVIYVFLFKCPGHPLNPLSPIVNI